MYCPLDGSAGNTSQEQFALFVNNLTPGTPIAPGSTVLLKSIKTGQFFKVVPVGGKQQVQCNIDPANAATQASPVVYTGSGLSYNGVPLTNPGGVDPLYVGGPGTSLVLQPGACGKAMPGRLAKRAIRLARGV